MKSSEVKVKEENPRSTITTSNQEFPVRKHNWKIRSRGQEICPNVNGIVALREVIDLGIVYSMRRIMKKKTNIIYQETTGDDMAQPGNSDTIVNEENFVRIVNQDITNTRRQESEPQEQANAGNRKPASTRVRIATIRDQTIQETENSSISPSGAGKPIVKKLRMLFESHAAKSPGNRKTVFKGKVSKLREVFSPVQKQKNHQEKYLGLSPNGKVRKRHETTSRLQPTCKAYFCATSPSQVSHPTNNFNPLAVQVKSNSSVRPNKVSGKEFCNQQE